MNASASTISTSTISPSSVSTPTVSNPAAARILLLTGSAAAVLMTLIGFLLLIAGSLVVTRTHIERFTGEIDGFSIALVFIGIAIALKTMEHRLRARIDYPSAE